MSDSFFRHDENDKPTGSVPELDEGATTDESTKEGMGAFTTDEGRMAAILAYIPFLCFVPLLSMRENKEARFHARQGVMLFLIELVAVLFLIDAISDLVFKGLLIVALALSVAGIIFAVQGKNYKLPVIGDLADKAKL